jgi:hypothetical protein
MFVKEVKDSLGMPEGTNLSSVHILTETTPWYVTEEMSLCQAADGV